MSDFSQAILEQALAPRTVRYFAETGSTNDDAIAWLHEGALPGAMIIADEQGSGRGRLGRPWYAPAGSSLLLSIIVEVPRQHLTRLTMVGALAVYDVIRSYNIDKVQIKWPNDVRIDGRKVCGVLPEAAWTGNLLLGAVLGIGLNVNVPFILTAYAETAISLSDALGEPIDRLETLRRLLGRIDHWLSQIATDDIFETWRARLLTLGTRVTVQTSAATYTGIAEDVTPDGGLLLRMDNGKLEYVLAGEILPPAGMH
ncbi:MAG: biotin--[acetyl-CoA-carboxylase] ligase [Chloroflexota bacterium]|nr:biotin--[acetyl-CoA-carboxylase] ligase [Chloroflexota bacterium]